MAPSWSVMRRVVLVVAGGLCLFVIGGGLYVGLFGLGDKQVHVVSYNSTGDFVCTDSRHLVFKDGGTIALCEGSEFLGPDGFTGEELDEAVTLVKSVAGDGRVDKADQRRLDELSERISRDHGENAKPHSDAGLIVMGAGLLVGCSLVLVLVINRSLRRASHPQA